MNVKRKVTWKDIFNNFKSVYPRLSKEARDYCPYNYMSIAENVSITSFEGETETTIMFQYGKDFFNGDIVQIANEYGHETKARILEIVRSEDKDGYSVYPTFKTIEQEGA